MKKNDVRSLSPVMSEEERADWIVRIDRLCAELTYQSDDAGAKLARALTLHLAAQRGLHAPQ